MKKKFMIFLGLSMIMSLFHGIKALTLVEALRCHKVCENLDGYIQATPGSNEGEVAALVKEVNISRKEVYSQIAVDRNLPPQAVVAIAIEMAKEESKKPENLGKFCR